MTDLSALAAYAPQSSTQSELHQRFNALATSYAEPSFDACARETAPGHLTASALVMSADGEHVLLTLHAKAGLWFQFGGHIDPTDLSLVAAAERELGEESGLDLRVDPVPVHLDVHEVPFCQPGVEIWHYDVRFLAVADPGQTPIRSAESHDVAWWPVAALPTAGLADLIAAGQRRLG